MSELNQKIEAIKKDVEVFASQFEGFKVVDAESQEKGSIATLEVRKRVKRIEELRTFFVKPLNDQVKNINDLFKAETEPLKALGAKIDAELKTFFLQEEARKEKELQEKLAQQRADEEAARKIKEEAEKAGVVVEVPTPQTIVEVHNSVEPVATTTKTASGSLSYKKVWTWKLEDEAKLRAARPDLFVLDEKKVNALVRDGVRELEGVTIYQDVQTSGRT